MPGCHPVLFQVIPVAISRLYSSFFPFDADGAITRNLIFMFGSLEKAKLRRGEEGKATLELSGVKRKCGKISKFSVKGGMKMH